MLNLAVIYFYYHIINNILKKLRSPLFIVNCERNNLFLLNTFWFFSLIEFVFLKKKFPEEN